MMVSRGFSYAPAVVVPDYRDKRICSVSKLNNSNIGFLGFLQDFWTEFISSLPRFSLDDIPNIRIVNGFAEIVEKNLPTDLKEHYWR